MVKKIFLAILLAFALVSCGKIAPRYLRSTPPTPEENVEENVTTGSARAYLVRPGVYAGVFYDDSTEIAAGGAWTPPLEDQSADRTVSIVNKPIDQVRQITPDEILTQLSSASFGYSVPEQANIDEEFEVTLIIDPTVVAKEIQAKLPDGQKVTGIVLVSRIVNADLVTRDFDVINVTPEKQVVLTSGATKWVWSLTPRNPGEGKIKVTITAIVNVDGEKGERHIDTYTNEIKVDITAKQWIVRWFENNWQWAWSALLIPLAGWGWAKRRGAKRSAE